MFYKFKVWFYGRFPYARTYALNHHMHVGGEPREGDKVPFTRAPWHKFS